MLQKYQEIDGPERRTLSLTQRPSGEFVPIDVQNRSSRFWMTMFIVLATCVFLWGLQYKLSLYEPQQSASHNIPMAKLLSQNELSSTSENSSYTQPKSRTKVLLAAFHALPIMLLILCAIFAAESSRCECVESHSQQLRQALLESFFVRPPPVLC